MPTMRACRSSSISPCCLFIVLFLLQFAAVRTVQSHSRVHRCCLGETFRLDFSIDHPPLHFWQEDQPVGFVVDMLRMITDELGLDLVVEYLGVENDLERLRRFRRGETSAALEDTVSRSILYGWNETLFGEEYRWYGQAIPSMTAVSVFEDKYAALLFQSRGSKSIWRLFAPFTHELWMGIVMSVFIFAILLVVLEIVGREESGAALSAQTCFEFVGKATYHAFAAALSGEDYEFVSWPGRLLRLSMLFFVLVTTATYTANLASFFTAPSSTILGPQYMDELQQAQVFTSSDLLVPFISPFVSNTRFLYHAPESSGGVLGGAEEYDVEEMFAWVYSSLRRRDIQAFIMPESFLRYYQVAGLGGTSGMDAASSQDDLCRDFVIPPGISFASMEVLFLFRPEDHVRAHNFSVALDWLRNQPAMVALRDKWFSTGQRCSSSSSRGAGGVLERVTLESQTGLFLICGSLAAASLLAALSSRLPSSPSLPRAPDPGGSAVSGGALVQRLPSLMRNRSAESRASRAAGGSKFEMLEEEPDAAHAPPDLQARRAVMPGPMANEGELLRALLAQVGEVIEQQSSLARRTQRIEDLLLPHGASLHPRATSPPPHRIDRAAAAAAGAYAEAAGRATEAKEGEVARYRLPLTHARGGREQRAAEQVPGPLKVESVDCNAASICSEA